MGGALQGRANRYVERPRRTKRTNRGYAEWGNNRVYVVCDHRTASQMGEDCAATGKDRLGAPQLSAMSILVKTVWGDSRRAWSHESTRNRTGACRPGTAGRAQDCYLDRPHWELGLRWRCQMFYWTDADFSAMFFNSERFLENHFWAGTSTEWRRE